MRSFLLKDKKPLMRWGLIPDGYMYKGEIPEGYNLAISPSPGYIVVDIDNHGDKNGFDIIPPVLMRELTGTLHYNTKNDGMHCWFKYTGTRKLANKTSNQGIDLRTEKGYVVWWHNKSIEDCLEDIKESSEQLNVWLESLFCYKRSNKEL